MGIKVYVSDGAIKKASSVTQVSSRLPRMSTGSGSRTGNILDLMDAVAVVPFLTASGALVGRGVIGPGYDIVEAELDVTGSKRKQKLIRDFFNYVPPDKSNIKDIFGPLAKIYTTAFAFRIFGHAAWEVVRDTKTGTALGFDLIPGVVRPNTERDGTFKSPAYTQFLRTNGVESKTDIQDPQNVVYFSVPDYGGNLYLAESLSLSEYTLPSEIYAAVAYRSLHENRNSPYTGFWYTPVDIDDDTFEKFVATVQARYTGSPNYGRNPIIMKGEGGFKSLSFERDDAPYIEGRALNRHEISAVSGVPGAKYGGEESSSADVRELRREFYESTLRPMMALMEEVVYRQICIGIFDAPEWRFRFRRPDFTTAVDDASIELRRIQWGQWSPNEARASRGEPPRDGGDYYLVPKNMDMVGPDGKPGRPENDPVDENEGTPDPSEEDTVPPTQPPEKPDTDENAIAEELRKWRKFELRVLSGKRYKREFVADVIPEELYDFISDLIEDVGDDTDSLSEIFDDAIAAVCNG